MAHRSSIAGVFIIVLSVIDLSTSVPLQDKRQGKLIASLLNRRVSNISHCSPIENSRRSRCPGREMAVAGHDVYQEKRQPGQVRHVRRHSDTSPLGCHSSALCNVSTYRVST